MELHRYDRAVRKVSMKPEQCVIELLDDLYTNKYTLNCTPDIKSSMIY